MSLSIAQSLPLTPRPVMNALEALIGASSPWIAAAWCIFAWFVPPFIASRKWSLRTRRVLSILGLTVALLGLLTLVASGRVGPTAALLGGSAILLLSTIFTVERLRRPGN